MVNKINPRTAKVGKLSLYQRPQVFPPPFINRSLRKFAVIKVGDSKQV